MRIALTITELHPGGAETCFVNLARFLQQQGHDVRVWQLWPSPPESRRQLTNRLESSGIEWASGGASRFWQFPGVCRWLRAELLDFQPEVVQSFLFHANVATAYAVRHSRAILVGGVRVRQPQAVRGKLQLWASKRMQKLVCVSESVAAHCIEREGIAREKVRVIPNGISMTNDSDQRKSWRQFGLPDQAKVLLFVGRLDHQKGVLEFLQNANAFLNCLPDHHLVIMGDGRLRSGLERVVGQLECRSRVHLVGWQEYAMDWMRAAEFLILPARYEGMPNVVMEAMSLGLPVVTFDVEGVRELLGDSLIGQSQIVPRSDYHVLAEKIVNLAQAHELRRECSEQNKQRIASEFGLEKQLLRYQELYFELAQAHHGS